jgi:hypothetical protein
MEFYVKPKPFKKSLLALIVGAISTQVLAVEVDVGQGKSTWSGEKFSESLTLTGTVTQPTNVTANLVTSNWMGCEYRRYEDRGVADQSGRYRSG